MPAILKSQVTSTEKTKVKAGKEAGHAENLEKLNEVLAQKRVDYEDFTKVLFRICAGGPIKP